jgi:hypothetical protein
VIGMGKNGVTGIIVPLDDEVIHRIFHHQPVIAIFVESVPADLEVGDRAFLYEKGGAVLEGEGSIAGISHEAAGEVRKKHGDGLSLSGDELEGYIASSGKQGSDQMLVLTLQDPIKYMKPLRCSGLSVGRDGTYMTKAVFSSILAENSQG